MKAKYSKERNEIRELPTMEMPLTASFQLMTFYQRANREYEEHLTSLRTILCSPEAKQIWEDGREVEEGKDFKIEDVQTGQRVVKSVEGIPFDVETYWQPTAIPLPAIKDEQEKYPIEFIMWYSGMVKEKIERAYERFKKEIQLCT